VGVYVHVHMLVYVHACICVRVCACVCVGHPTSRFKVIINMDTYVADVHVLFVL
jgi:hypothetical protein